MRPLFVLDLLGCMLIGPVFLSQFYPITGNKLQFLNWTNTGAPASARSFKFIMAQKLPNTYLPLSHHSVINPLLVLDSLGYILIGPIVLRKCLAVSGKSS